MLRRAVLGNEVIQPRHHARRIVFQDHRGHRRDANFKPVLAGGLVGQGKQQQGHMAAGLPIAFHRGDLGGLVLQRVQPVHVARKDLHGNEERAQCQAKAKPRGHGGRAVVAQPAPSGKPCDQEGHRQAAGQKHMGQPVGHRGVEDDRPPVGGIDDPVAQLIPRRGVHPAVKDKDPKRAHRGAEGDEEGGQCVQPPRHAAGPKKHDP